MKENIMNYVIRTDGFLWENTAETLDEAITNAFDGKIIDRASLEAKFAKYISDGGWCWIEEDGVRVLEIGSV